MSQHFISTRTPGGIPVTVLTGWDTANHAYFLTVRRTDIGIDDDSGDAELFSTESLPRSLPAPQRYEPLLTLLEGMGIVLPRAVLEDLRFCADPLALAA
jgi:hypothetical protein